MLKTLVLSSLLLGSVAMTATEVSAQGAPQSIAPYKVDLSTVQSGYRATKVIGASVYNEANEKVGTVDDLIVTRNDRIPYAIISVGGFLGIGDRLVAIAYNQLTFRSDNTIQLNNATKDLLSKLPAFTYNK